jgi:hypothetical protein
MKLVLTILLMNGSIVTFDFYNEKYIDIKSNEIDPVFHFHNHGKWEWRQPRAFMERNEKQYIYYLRPLLKYRIFRIIEKIFRSEYSINHKRNYTFNDLLSDHNHEEIEALFKLPNAKAFYFFQNGFIEFQITYPGITLSANYLTRFYISLVVYDVDEEDLLLKDTPQVDYKNFDAHMNIHNGRIPK